MQDFVSVVFWVLGYIKKLNKKLHRKLHKKLHETYTRTPESKYINVRHFMRGLQDKMTNDQDFVQSVLRNGSRSYQKVNLILEGKSIA